MRPLEIAILVLDFLAIAALNLPALFKSRWFRFLPTVTLLVTLVQLAVEHYRWQMVPAYLLTGMLLLISLPGVLKPAQKPRQQGLASIALGGLELLWLSIAILLPLLLPVPLLPTPPGPYAIGSVTYAWTDPARAEIYSGDPNDKRRVVVQIWYPAAPAIGAQTGKLIDRLDLAGPVAAASLGLPAFALDHLDLVRTHTYPNAPLAKAERPYPIVLLSHGYTGFRAAYFNQLEALAGSGYVAVGIDHPYGAMFTVFPDGQIVLNDPAIFPGREQPVEFQRASETLESVYAGDVRFVMDRLQQLNTGAPDPRFAGRLDLQRIGLYGHSTGGGAIVWACSLDPRCKAGLGMDAWLEPLPGAVISKPLSQPFLFMRSERTEVWSPGENDPRLDTLYRGVAQEGYRMTILGTMHDDFTVVPLLTPITALLPERGPLPAERTLQIVTDYVLAFFDKHLKDKPTPLLDGASPAYPEVQFESHGQLK